MCVRAFAAWELDAVHRTVGSQAGLIELRVHMAHPLYRRREQVPEARGGLSLQHDIYQRAHT